MLPRRERLVDVARRRNPPASASVVRELRPVISAISRDLDLATSALDHGQTRESWQRVLDAYGQVNFALGLLEEAIRLDPDDDTVLEEMEMGLVAVHGRLQATVLTGVGGRRPDLAWTAPPRPSLPNPR